jgi:transposase-like protein
MSKPVIQTKQLRKKFDKEFKQRAVELWLNSGRTATEVAAELGFHAQRLSAWRQRFAPPPPRGEGGGGPPAYQFPRYVGTPSGSRRQPLPRRATWRQPEPL